MYADLNNLTSADAVLRAHGLNPCMQQARWYTESLGNFQQAESRSSECVMAISCASSSRNPGPIPTLSPHGPHPAHARVGTVEDNKKISTTSVMVLKARCIHLSLPLHLPLHHDVPPCPAHSLGRSPFLQPI